MSVALTIDTAREAMLTVLKTVVDANSLPILWPDVPGAPPATGPYVRARIQHMQGKQSSLSSAVGSRLQTHTGTLSVLLHVPAGQGGTTGYALAQSILAAYRAERGSVWYRNPRFRELPEAQGAYAVFNVLVDFTYDT